jgi:hypothetical protein
MNFTNNTFDTIKMNDAFQLVGYGASLHHVKIDRNTIRNVPRDAIQVRQTTTLPGSTAHDISITNNTVIDARGCVNIFTDATPHYVTPTRVFRLGNSCKRTLGAGTSTR